MKDRIRTLRKVLNLNQTEFGEKIGIKQGPGAGYETGARIPLDADVTSICKEFSVNEDWLRNGNGEMFEKLPEEDETAAYVSDLLEDDDNPLYIIIKETMKTFHELSPKSQEAFCEFSKKLLDNLAEHKKKES